MKDNSEQLYKAFWDKLSLAYPISGGNIRIPVATTLTTLPNFDKKIILAELRQILQNLLDKHGTEEAAKARANAMGDSFITPLITNEYTGVVRFDCIWQPKTNTVKILEINCDYPDGLLLHDSTYSLLSQTRNQSHHDLILELFGDNKAVHVLYSERASFVDSYHTEHISLISSGKESSIGHNVSEIPAEATVRRCLETSKITEEQVNRLKTVNHRYINTFALRTLGYKDLLEQLNHDFIPKTIKLNPDTKSYILSEQEKLIVKPADGCEGFGIYFGNKFTTKAWSTLIQSLIEKNYIAQELVEIPKQAVSLFDQGTIIMKELYFDLCPHFFIKNGRVTDDGHILMRYSENLIVNVSQGGGIGYYKL